MLLELDVDIGEREVELLDAVEAEAEAEAEEAVSEPDQAVEEVSVLVAAAVVPLYSVVAAKELVWSVVDVELANSGDNRVVDDDALDIVAADSAVEAVLSEDEVDSAVEGVVSTALLSVDGRLVVLVTVALGEALSAVLLRPVESVEEMSEGPRTVKFDQDVENVLEARAEVDPIDADSPDDWVLVGEKAVDCDEEFVEILSIIVAVEVTTTVVSMPPSGDELDNARPLEPLAADSELMLLSALLISLVELDSSEVGPATVTFELGPYEVVSGPATVTFEDDSYKVVNGRAVAFLLGKGAREQPYPKQLDELELKIAVD